MKGEVMSGRSTEHTKTHTVRPRWTWIALVVMAAGLVLIGVGIIVPSWAWATTGLVLLVLGGVAGLYGGFFYDVQGGSSPSIQMREVKEGDEYEFPDAGSTRSEAEVKKDVRERWLSDGE
jgi:predicted membrane channel-forming protein YqfA (hemolysin III family)